MAGALSDFYSGAMLAPDRKPNGTLTQSQVYSPGASVQQMYAGIYGEAPPAAPPSVSSLFDPTGPGTDWGSFTGMRDDPLYGGNSGTTQVARAPARTIDAANPLDINRLGLTSDPFRTPAQRAIDTAAPKGGSIADLFSEGARSVAGSIAPGSTLSWGAPSFPIDSNVPSNLGSYDPATIAALKTKYPPKAAAAPSISDLYTPPPAAPPAERFLQDRGYNTAGMNATDRQTALNAALNGSANGGSRDMSVVPKSVRFQ